MFKSIKTLVYNTYKILIPIAYFIFSCFLGMLIYEYIPIHMYNDTPSYEKFANEILMHHGNYFFDDFKYFRTPGYPIFLSIFYAVKLKWLVPFFQNFLVSVALYLLLEMGELLNVRRCVCILAVCGILFDINIIIHSRLILTDILFSVMLVYAFYFWTKFLCGGKTQTKYMVLFSFFLSYALLIRPIILYFNILLLVALGVCVLFKRLSLKHWLVYLGVFCILIGSWFVRNYVYTGEIVYSTVSDYNLLKWNARYVYNYENGNDLELNSNDEMDALIWEYIDKEEFDDLDYVEQMKYYGIAGKNYITEHMKSSLIVSGIGLFKVYFGAIREFWINICQDNNQIAQIFIWLYRVFLLIMYPFCLWSFFRKRKQINFVDVSLFIMILYLSLVSSPCGASRFRLPISMLISAWIIVLNKKEGCETNNIMDILLGKRIEHKCD